MSALTNATLVAEVVFIFPDGSRPAVRVIPHDEEGKKPRGKAGKGKLIVANPGESVSDVLRTVAGFLEQEGSWQAFAEVSA